MLWVIDFFYRHSQKTNSLTELQHNGFSIIKNILPKGQSNPLNVLFLK